MSSYVISISACIAHCAWELTAARWSVQQHSGWRRQAEVRVQFRVQQRVVNQLAQVLQSGGQPAQVRVAEVGSNEGGLPAVGR